MKNIYLIITAMALIFCILPRNASSLPEGKSPILSAVIKETGQNKEGKPVYSVQADHIDMAELLKAIFQKAGMQYLIDQDISGPITLSLKNQTMDDLLQNIQMAARPKLEIAMGQTIHVSRAPMNELAVNTGNAQNSMANGAGGYGGGFGGYAGGNGGFGGSNTSANAMQSRAANNALQAQSFQQSANAYLNRVTIRVPEKQAIPLNKALEDMQQQANVPIRMSSDIPQSVTFSGRMVNTPLNVALEAIARTAGLKVVSEEDGSYLLTPSDRFQILFKNMLLGNYPEHPVQFCTKCGYPLLPQWNYCPDCGQITSHGTEAMRAHLLKSRAPVLNNKSLPTAPAKPGGR